LSKLQLAKVGACFETQSNTLTNASLALGL